jgi:hypothetical protein
MRFAPLTLAVLLAACSPAQVPFSVVFPSEETFVVTSTMRVRVFPAAASTCPSLVGRASRDIDISEAALFDRTQIDPCAFRAGISLPDTGSGDRLFLIESFDDRGNTILVGCSQDEVYGGASVTVNISTTDRYPMARMENPSTQTAAERCAGGV